MAFYSGLDGQLYLNGSKVGKVQNWSLNASQAVLETTSLEDTDRTLINGVRSMSGSCRVFYHSDGNASDFINNIIKSGATSAEDGVATQSTTALFKLHVDSSKYIEVYAWITGASMSMSVGEVFSVDVTFEVTGHAKAETV
jgi:hypothetical protein